MKRLKPVFFAAVFAALLAVSAFLTERTADVMPPETTQTETATVTVESVAVAQTQAPETAATESPSATSTTCVQTTACFAPVTVNTSEGAHENSSSDITLNVELPSANGEIYVDAQPTNKYIAIVTDARKLDAAKLVAVFSLPDTGQNYVLEFKTGNGERTADALVRVFLIDTKGRITSVCSSDYRLCENVSTVENWFCMNVILKRMVLPAIKDRL